MPLLGSRWAFYRLHLPLAPPLFLHVRGRIRSLKIDLIRCVSDPDAGKSMSCKLIAEYSDAEADLANGKKLEVGWQRDKDWSRSGSWCAVGIGDDAEEGDDVEHIPG